MTSERLRVLRKYNLREKANIYAGFVIGTAITPVAIRYSLFNSLSGSPLEESIAWAGSTLLSFLPIGEKGDRIPFIVYPASLGGALGIYSAMDLKGKREKREAHEEKLAEQDLI